MIGILRFALFAAAAASASCTVHGDKTPPLTGPSEFSQSITLTATPDSILQDGASQSSIVVTVRDANGKGLSALTLRLGMAVDDIVQDYGILSARTVVTGSDGRATAIYTAPPPPPSIVGGAGNFVTITATPIGSNYQTANSVGAELRLVPPGVVLPPAGTPIAKFTFPTPVSTGVAGSFDASSSCPTATPCSTPAGLTRFEWNFGDGAVGSGQSTQHTYAVAGSYTVTLTVTNDRGVSAVFSAVVTVVTTELPKAVFVASPTDPGINTPVSFNASGSTAAPGHVLTQFIWDFGKGEGNQPGGSVMQSTFTEFRSFTVVLTVVDDLGHTATTSSVVTVKPPTAIVTGR
jgi:PKD repeat protein